MSEYTGETITSYYSAHWCELSISDLDIEIGGEDWEKLAEPVKEKSRRQKEKMDAGDKLIYDGFYIIKTTEGDFRIMFEKSKIEKLVNNIIGSISWIDKLVG